LSDERVVVDDDYELPYLYWILKLHKTPYKQIYIAGYQKCTGTTKPLSIVLTKILTAVKDRLQMYYNPLYMPEVGLIICGFSKIQKDY
jgi:hypothetical protein